MKPTLQVSMREENRIGENLQLAELIYPIARKNIKWLKTIDNVGIELDIIDQPLRLRLSDEGTFKLLH